MGQINSQANGGGDSPTIMEKGLRFPGIGSCLLFWPFTSASGIILLQVGVSFRTNALQGAYTEAQDPLNFPLPWGSLILYHRTYKPKSQSSSLYCILFLILMPCSLSSCLTDGPWAFLAPSPFNLFSIQSDLGSLHPWAGYIILQLLYRYSDQNIVKPSRLDPLPHRITCSN